MKIALIGSRGIPAAYSGFETFYEQLSVRLAERGHAVTVYNRSHFVKRREREYRGVRLVRLPSIPTKHLDTITHTFCSTLHALTQRYDIAYYCIVGNSPLVWLPRLVGARTLLNVDGEDWAREKWGWFARRYQLISERIATRTANIIVADAKGIRDRYRRAYGIDTVFVPYGANIQRDEASAALERWGLQPRRYLLYVGRLVPENAVDLLISAYRDVRTDMPLVIVGDAPFMDEYKAMLRKAADDRVVFTGYAFGSDYAQLSSHAYLYVQPSAIEGTRPALLDQMGFGNCVVVRGSRVNREVVDGFGCVFEQDSPRESLAETLERLISEPATVEAYRATVRQRISSYYDWEWVTDFYEDMFRRMLQKRTLIDYEDFVASLSQQ
jgi:glycosyltransferase involved in cell wall biosynthesis